jgi:hypothetical protein
VSISFLSLPATPLYFVKLGYDYTDVQDEGIKAGEIIAWRCWRLIDGLLWSVVIDETWLPGKPLTAIGGMKELGIHAWRDRLRAVLYANSSHLALRSNIMILGTVAMWGEVVEHERGYRAEYARVNSIDASRDVDVDELRILYELEA